MMTVYSLLRPLREIIYISTNIATDVSSSNTLFKNKYTLSNFHSSHKSNMTFFSLSLAYITLMMFIIVSVLHIMGISLSACS